MDAYREGHEFSSVISGGKKVATNIEWSAEGKLTRLQRNGNGKSCLAPVLRPGPLSTVIESYLIDLNRLGTASADSSAVSVKLRRSTILSVRERATNGTTKDGRR